MIRTEVLPAQTKAELLAPFDYSSIDAVKAKRAKAAAEYINSRQKTVVATMLEIGTKLLEVKEDLEHGQFQNWVHTELDWTIRTAQNYMKAASAFAGKSETVSYLPVSTVYQLAKVAEPIRAEVIKHIEAGQIPVEAIEKIVSHAKLADEKARKSFEQKAMNKALTKREREKDRQESEAKQEARDAAQLELVALIKSKFTSDERLHLIKLFDAVNIDAFGMANFLKLPVFRHARSSDSGV